ncbi:type I restriction enzyme HsdR N-terminal domain-containing protein [Kaistella sp. G5-32]|uniref:Type I restriction enzyme HsdR N-terminal domain-containing protein n=1 Tax=Kaistella gelatinilytica TaxID=2787636 RepID=A0ABS0F892_9FLAO|nr:type I restriction enzyme HsdR N-terminal domain-containing protein [Kaistella gelatinilytica]MBF8455920.1 type I restriction enzyme HsdR N-terminal domain-containing protein [Kaistella gelatinilytica]
MELPKLNFNEDFVFQIKRDKDKFFIYDVVRKSWFLLTPEEWVRQHWVHYFHFIKSRNLSSLILEKKLILNGTTKRIDLLVTEKTTAKILVECKAPEIKLTEKTFEQTARYNSVLLAEEIILSNGLQHISAKFIDGKYEFYKGEF